MSYEPYQIEKAHLRTFIKPGEKRWSKKALHRKERRKNKKLEHLLKLNPDFEDYPIKYKRKYMGWIL